MHGGAARIRWQEERLSPCPRVDGPKGRVIQALGDRVLEVVKDEGGDNALDAEALDLSEIQMMRVLKAMPSAASCRMRAWTSCIKASAPLHQCRSRSALP